MALATDNPRAEDVRALTPASTLDGQLDRARARTITTRRARGRALGSTPAYAAA
jgi:hypothetical protein